MSTTTHAPTAADPAVILAEREAALRAVGIAEVGRQAIEEDARALAAAAGAWVDDFERSMPGIFPSPEEADLIAAVKAWRGRFA